MPAHDNCISLPDICRLIAGVRQNPLNFVSHSGRAVPS